MVYVENRHFRPTVAGHRHFGYTTVNYCTNVGNVRTMEGFLLNEHTFRRIEKDFICLSSVENTFK